MPRHRLGTTGFAHRKCNGHFHLNLCATERSQPPAPMASQRSGAFAATPRLPPMPDRFGDPHHAPKAQRDCRQQRVCAVPQRVFPKGPLTAADLAVKLSVKRHGGGGCLGSEAAPATRGSSWPPRSAGLPREHLASDEVPAQCAIPHRACTHLSRRVGGDTVADAVFLLRRAVQRKLRSEMIRQPL